MITKKIEFRRRLAETGSLIGTFLDKKISEADHNIKNNNFPTYEIILEKIDSLLGSCLGNAAVITVDDGHLIESCREDVLAFYNPIIDHYYKNFKRELPKWSFGNIDNSLRSTFLEDLNIQTKEEFGFYEFKLGLFDLLSIHMKLFEQVFEKSKELFLSHEDSPVIVIDTSPYKKLTFEGINTLDLINEVFQPYFIGREVDFDRVLKGEHITGKLTFPHNQSQFTEVFRRLKYNRRLVNSNVEIADWICYNFNYRHTRSNVEVIKDFNRNSVIEILNGKTEPASGQRICNVEWLGYKNPTLVKKEKEYAKIN